LATQPICLVMLLMRMFAPIFGGKFMEKDFHVEFARTYLVLLCCWSLILWFLPWYLNVVVSPVPPSVRRSYFLATRQHHPETRNPRCLCFPTVFPEGKLVLFAVKNVGLELLTRKRGTGIKSGLQLCYFWKKKKPSTV
jgi:hypothetical protein